MTPKAYASLVLKRDDAERIMVRAQRRWQKLRDQCKRAERVLDKEFHAQAALPAETTPTIPGKADIRKLEQWDNQLDELNRKYPEGYVLIP